MRVALGGYVAAVNSFATQTLGVEDYRRGTRGPEAVMEMARVASPANASAGFARVAAQRGWEIVPLQSIYSGLGGTIASEAHEMAKRDFQDLLRAAGRLDGIFLQLHGAGVVDGCEDLEGDFLAAVREVVGDSIPIMTSCDLHATLTPAWVELATPIPVKTNPHDDYMLMGEKAGHLMAGVFDGALSPTRGWAQPDMVPALQKLYIAPGWPLDHLMRQAQNLAARDPRVLDASIVGGFFCNDVHHSGVAVVVTTNGEPELARHLALEISENCWAARHAFRTDMVSVEEGVREAMESGEGPVILGDLADSGGAGTPGDGTAVLAELLSQGAEGAVVGNITDPEAAAEAIRAGVGAEVSLRVGGKVDAHHGDPVDIRGRVKLIQAGTYEVECSFASSAQDRGPTVVVDCGGIEVILTSNPTYGFEPGHFRSLGIEPAARKILAVKAELHHRPGLAPVAHKFIDVDAPGLATQDLSRLPYKRIRRPIFPLDDI